MNRRSFLKLSAAAAAAVSSARSRLAPAAAPISGDQTKFIFIIADGGWDPTRVFAPAYDLEGVSMEEDGDVQVAGGLMFVDHPDRPAVARFLDSNHDRTLFINGIQTASIAHAICMQDILTGSREEDGAGWPDLIAATSPGMSLPHLVLGGACLPGAHTGNVARAGTNGQLGRLLEEPESDLRRLENTVLDRYLQQRADEQATHTDTRAMLAGDFAVAHDRALSLRGRAEILSQDAGTLDEKMALAVSVLSEGISRCVTIGADESESWDSHSDNDATQSALFEDLFISLDTLVRMLEVAPGTSASTLAEETVVVVLSEMGRAPALNSGGGKDHWPVTSAMVIGDCIAGSQTIGAFDERFLGMPVDPITGALDADGETLTPAMLGAALLDLAEVERPASLVDVSALPIFA